ncbi:sugar kinase [Secundilactobacillus kimchicus]|uniref:2-dehydro-3-deoxygluconokinase n=1 Tax=Secundilactobacillus kimchicus JCM 15530 TaxID=1302272 RepID=A0A0R1HNH0_9LACO|nr:sugar kinase [Secundilactobacillus kimchicus]KRK48381.1 2-dehydro-3-deoxygluconokinase [Secundilactobacillus kimchicus JCM 15530]MBT9671126.1 sugar kinase [Secundilactobacillus kimchicus]
MAEFLTIGEPMAVFASEDVDQSLVDAKKFSKFAAGAELNVAIGVSRLRHSAAYVTAVGDDPFGEFLIKAMGNTGVDAKYVKKNPEFWTGFYLKERVSHGDPSTFYYRKNSAAAHYRMKDLDEINLDEIKIAHLSGIFAAISDGDLEVLKELGKRLQEKGKLITFDPNLRPALWASQERMVEVTNELAKMATIVVPGVNEGKILVNSDDPETIANFYLNQGNQTKAVIVKVGPKGAYIRQKNQPGRVVEGFKVDKVVDTVGAGDGFAVGLITGLLEGLSLDDTVKRGCAVGALAVMSPGDNDGYPTPEELNNFMN